MRRLLFCLLPLITAAWFALPVAAAPQILLAVSSEGDIPMRCGDRRCEAEIGTICLQPDRPDPARDAPYTLLDPKTLQLVAEARSGRHVQIAPTGGLRIVAARGHTAVRVSIDRTRLAKGGLTRPALRLEGAVIFTPQPLDGDAEPQSDADAALARTTLRRIAAKAVRLQTGRAQAAGAILRAINTLPRDRPPTRVEHAVAERRLRSAALPEPASKLVRDAIGHCRSVGTTFIAQEPLFSYRGCLAVNHDTMLEEIFMDYRAILKTTPAG